MQKKIEKLPYPQKKSRMGLFRKTEAVQPPSWLVKNGPATMDEGKSFQQEPTPNDSCDRSTGKIESKHAR